MLDTLDYARRLESAGFTREQAEGAAEALAAALSERVASKDDLRAAVAELRHELELGLAGLRREFILLRRVDVNQDLERPRRTLGNDGR